MTVKELIEELQNYSDDAEVFFTCDYGDYHHTQQALKIDEVRDLDSNERIEKSAYSHSGWAVESMSESEEREMEEAGEEFDIQDWREEEHDSNVVLLG